jgi:hypothetical protein
MKETEGEDSPIIPGQSEESHPKTVNLPVPFVGPQRTAPTALSIIQSALLACSVVALAFWILYPRDAEPRPPVEPDAPGWSELESCAETTSFDGTKRLTLLAKGGASYEEVKPEGADQEATKEGKWSLEAAPNRYRIEVGEVERTYLLVKPTGSSGCLLIAGELRSADLTASWFFFGVGRDDGSDGQGPFNHDDI